MLRLGPPAPRKPSVPVSDLLSELSDEMLIRLTLDGAPVITREDAKLAHELRQQGTTTTSNLNLVHLGVFGAVVASLGLGWTIWSAREKPTPPETPKAEYASRNTRGPAPLADCKPPARK